MAILMNELESISRAMRETPARQTGNYWATMLAAASVQREVDRGVTTLSLPGGFLALETVKHPRQLDRKVFRRVMDAILREEERAGFVKKK